MEEGLQDACPVTLSLICSKNTRNCAL